MSDRGEGYQNLWGWFGLSRASWVCLPRVLMHEMPDEWQATMARLLNEFNDEFPAAPIGSMSVTRKEGRRFAKWPEALTNYRHPQYDEIDEYRGRADV